MKNRPILISLIASQGVIVSVFILYSMITWSFDLNILMMNITLLVFILLASFGLWKGREWGWWLTNIYYLNILFGMIVSTINFIYFIPRKYEDFEVGLTTIISPLGTVALIVGLLIPILLFRKNSLDYFNIKKHKLKLILIILIAIAWYFKDFLLT